MKYAKATIALLVCLPGALMPWRCRIWYSEVLGWLAQLVPPALYQMQDLGEEDDAE